MKNAKPKSNRFWDHIKLQMRLRSEPENRDRMLTLFSDEHKEIVSAIRADRTYKLPKDYISWEIISLIAALSLKTGNDADAVSQRSGFIHSHKFALWFVQDAPIYLLSQELFEAFDQTQALHKPGVMTGWQPSLPSFLLALPKGALLTPQGAEMDYLLVFFSDIDHKEWSSGRWGKYRIDTIEPYASPHYRYFQLLTIDKKETIWTSGTGVSMTGDAKLIYSDEDWGNIRLTATDRDFISRLRNIVINCILAIQFAPSLVTGVTDDEVPSVVSKGFAKPKETANSIRYGRWLGRNYKRRTASLSGGGGGTHRSPHPHWREGHWKVLEVGENKPWKENKRLWIQPTYVAPK